MKGTVLVSDTKQPVTEKASQFLFKLFEHADHRVS